MQADTDGEEFAGQLVVVTGAAAGIGAAIVRMLAARGADVACADIDTIDPGYLASLAVRRGQRLQSWVCDVMRSQDVRDVCADIARTLGDPSVLINNVGGSGANNIVAIEDMTDDAWDRTLSLNLGSVMRFCRSLVPAMKARRYGKIVNVSSTLMNGMRGAAGTVGARLPYVAAKAGIVGLTKQLAKDLGPFGIAVNAIAPGFTLPDEEARITRKFRALPPEQQRPLVADIPMGRPGDGADMAYAACFLASPRNSYVSGQILAVDGGG
jgi:NAD(P)-dependent dehydrogenase (short-subunit alcohol dehydrogenase family)